MYESKLPSTREALEESHHIFTVAPDDIDGFTITNPETKIELRKRDNRWYIDAPVKDLADATVLDQLFSAINSTVIDSRIDDARSSLKEFGLIKPNSSLKILGKNAPPELLLGKDGAVENKMYAREENSNTAYLIGTELKAQIQRKADDFRDHRLIPMDANLIDKLTIKSAAGELLLEKIDTHWQIQKPLKARGDDARITDLIAQTFSGPIQSFADGKETVATTGLAEPRGSVIFSAPGMEKPSTLEIGQRLPGNGVIYARISSRNALFTVLEKVQEILDTRPDDIRDRRLIRLNSDMVDRVNLEPAGKPRIILARNGESWTIKSSGDHPANAEAVRKLIESLQSQQAAFVANAASDLPKYGLDNPSLRITFSAYASENTAETKAGEEPFAVLSFGRTEGASVYARIEEEPFIVSAPAALFRSIPQDPIEWQDLAVLKLKPGDIGTIDLQHDAEAKVSVARDGANWKSPTGQPVNAAGAETIANLFASLRAVRWVGPLVLNQGFVQPKITASVTVKGQKPETLLIGRQTPSGMWYATIQGSGAVFEMSQPDIDALLAPLLTPAPVVPRTSSTATLDTGTSHK